MKIQVVSDLHLEFLSDFPLLENADNSGVLILGGDICLAEHLYRNPRYSIDIHGDVKDLSNVMNNGGYSRDAERYRRFFDHCSQNWDHVIYVMGNHEHYSGRWNRTEEVLREELKPYPNIHLLEQEKLVLDGTVFLGASLWTDMNNQDPITMHAVKDMMSDYRAVTEENSGVYHKLRPVTTVKQHLETVKWMRFMLSEDSRPTVVVTHHAPSRQSVHPRYYGQDIMNGAFYTELSDIMLDFDHIKLWTHGHVHDPHDYQINNTRVLCNPYGYPGEKVDFNPSLVAVV
jgi:Icc-related predicted phosphoesterase